MESLSQRDVRGLVHELGRALVAKVSQVHKRRRAERLLRSSDLYQRQQAGEISFLLSLVQIKPFGS